MTPTLCLVNARICKKHYLVALAVELVVKRFETVRHTPNILFSSFAKTFYNSDVLCIEMLQSIAQQQYANSIIFTFRLMQHWKTPLEVWSNSTITISTCDILVSKKAGSSMLLIEPHCTTSNIMRNNHSLICLLTSLSNCVVRSYVLQPNEQHRRYTKSDAPDYKVPMFLQHTEKSTVDIQRHSIEQTLHLPCM